MKKIILLLCVMCPMFMFGQNVAYVYGDSILLSVPAYSKNVLKIDSTRQAFKKEVEASVAAIQKQYDKLVKPYAPKESETLLALKKRMSAVDTLSLNMIIDDNKQLQTKQQNYDRIIQASYAKEVQPILDHVNSIIKEYAVANKITMIVGMEQMRQALIYVDPKQNITAPIIASLKKKK
jgi:Skp family chaperone for outer membrane proteins